MSRHFDDRAGEWTEYYDAFPELDRRLLREHCEPRIWLHPTRPRRAVVLLHGLTDSPYFMMAIAQRFFDDLGCDVYLPLLQGHGLREPEGMEQVDLNEWKRNVRFATDQAYSRSGSVDIGGLSMGGALAFHAAATDARIRSLFLFSAALDIPGGPMGLFGELIERTLRTPISNLFDTQRPMIGDNPFRYSRMDVDGAQQLALLMAENDEILRGFEDQPFAKNVFAAHSEIDTASSIEKIEALERRTQPERFEWFRIPRSAAVRHASVVLASPVHALDAAPDEEPLEAANPLFDRMMDRAVAAARTFHRHEEPT